MSEGVKIGLVRGYSGHVQKQASKCGKNRQVLAGFSEMVNLGVQNGPKIGVKIGVFLGYIWRTKIGVKNRGIFRVFLRVYFEV